MRNRKLAIAVNVALGVAVAALIVLNVRMAQAHDWMPGGKPLHWHTRNVGHEWAGGDYKSEADAAIADWHQNTVMNLSASNSSNLTVRDGNFGATGWAGLASVSYYTNDSQHSGQAQIASCTASYNSHYGKPGSIEWWFQGESTYRQAVYCQEIGHCLGLAHSNDGCMGVSYYWLQGGSTSTPHTRNDVNDKH